MVKTNDIQNSYGKTISIAIANTGLDNLLNTYGLPKNSIIVNTEYDSDNETDIGYASMSITDYEGAPSVLIRHIEEKNGLHSDIENPNSIYLHIDDNVFSNNESLALNLDNLVDNDTLFVENGKIHISVDNLEKASSTQFGVVKPDNNTIISDNGVIYVATDNLDYANGNVVGISKGDNTTIIASNGTLSVNTEYLDKASNSSYGIAKPDNLTINSNNGILELNVDGIGTLSTDGFGLNKADNDTILQTNGVLSINENSIPIASNSSVGIVKLDQNTLETDSDGVLNIKSYEENMAYIYSLQNGIDTVEEKISYVRNFLDNQQYQLNAPIIRHLSCNETTTSILTVPEAMEEPINMPIQHIYVSLNVITNCEFSIDIDYENNETPMIELDNINYNDEYSIHGIEAIEHNWESTNMQEKNIIMLFNCKNFLSSTGPATDITKLNITVSAKDNSNEFKNIIYSIIRYNSYFIEPEPELEEEPEEDIEFIIDESKSKWIMTDGNISLDLIKYNEENNIDYSFHIISKAYLTDPENISTVNIAMMINNPSYELYLIGAYTDIRRNEIKYFYKKLDIRSFLININGTYIYEYLYKVKFDVLSYKIKYYVVIPSVTFGNNNEKYYVLEHNYYKDRIKSGNLACVINNPNNEIISYMKINNSILTADNVNSSFIFKDNNNTYFIIDIDYSNNIISYNSYILSYNINNANIYLVDPRYIEYGLENSRISNLDLLYNSGYAGKIMLTTNNKMYDTYAYLYIDANDQIKNEYEFIYGTDSDDLPTYVYAFASKKYGNVKESFNINDLYDITYTTEFYSLNNNNEDFKNDTVNIYNPVEHIFDLKGDNYNISNALYAYCFLMNYNISKIESSVIVPQTNYYETDLTTSFIVRPVSVPRIDLTGLTINESEITLNNLDYSMKFVHSINENDDVNDLADTLVVSYLYTIQHNFTEISFANDSCNYGIMKIDCSDISNPISYSIEIVGVKNGSVNYIQPEVLQSSTYQFDANHYKQNDFILAFAFETTNTYNYSNVIGDFVLACDLPQFDLTLSTPIFIGSSYYAYFEVNCPKYGRNAINQLEIGFENQNGYSYIAQNTYYRHDLSISNVLYTEKYLYNPYTKADSYQFNDFEINNIPKVVFNCSNFSVQNAYCGYMSNSKFVFNLGTINTSVNNVSLYSKLSYIIGNYQFEHELTLVEDNETLLGIIDEHMDLENAEYMFITSYGYYSENNTYYNSQITNISFDESESKFIITNNNISYFYDDAIVALLRNACSYSENVVNSANLKLELYNGRQLTHTIVALENDVLNVNQQRTSVSSLSTIGLLKHVSNDYFNYDRSNTNNSVHSSSHTIEVPITYIYNIPNLTNGFEQYCCCDIYTDYFVARFNKPYDKFFTPYDYTITAHRETDNDDILNKPIYFETEYRNNVTNDIALQQNSIAARTINIIFEIKYKGVIVYYKRIPVIKPNDFTKTTYLINYLDNQITEQNKALNKTCAYYTYSATNKYAYSQLYTYVDTSYYSKIIFEEINANNKQAFSMPQEKLKGLREFSLSESGTFELLNSHEAFVANSLNLYLKHTDNNDIIWKLNKEEQSIYSFNLCQVGDNKLKIIPELKSDYRLDKITII